MRDVAGKLMSSLSPRVVRAMTVVLAGLTLAGGCIRATDEYRNWMVARSAQRWLAAVQIRQHEYYRTARRYAPTLETLGLAPPAESRARMFTFRAGRRAMFLAEICTLRQCWLTDPSGNLRVRSLDIGELLPAGGWFVPGGADGARAWWPIASTPSQSARAPGAPRVSGAAGAPEFEPPARAAADARETRPTARTTAGEARDSELSAVPRSRTVVIPRMDPQAIGLGPGDPLPPLSSTRDSPALWGTIEEVKR